MKKILLLGGSRYLVPVIEAAHKLGLYVITCDYLPNNYAHRLSDEYLNISIVNKDEVLNAALKHNIDGIMSFACDPGVVTAAYVAEKLNLPFQTSYKSACILQDKGLFRSFLIENNFNSPFSKSYCHADDVIREIGSFSFPVMVKPVDSAGSKGVSKANNLSELHNAIAFARENSISKKFIVEEFIEFDGYHSSADVFTVDGRLCFSTYSDQLFDKHSDNPYTPSLIIWPSTMKTKHQKYLDTELQRLFKLLGVKTGIYNVETCIGKNGKPYIMEVSPRGGGCKIAEIQKLAFGIDLIEAEVKKTVGIKTNISPSSSCEGNWCEMVIHANCDKDKQYKGLVIEPGILQKHVKVIDLSVSKGDIVTPFSGANASIGDMFLKFDSREELDEVMSDSSKWLNIELI